MTGVLYSMAIPFVGVIIERENNGAVEVRIQTRRKPEKLFPPELPAWEYYFKEREL